MFKTVWNFLRPVILVVIAFIGWTLACNGFDGKVFLSIIILSIILDGKGIKDGFVAIYNYFFSKKV